MNSILNTRTLQSSYQRITRVQLRVVDGPDRGRQIDIDAAPDGARTIHGGRSRINQLVLTDEHVSDIHFELQLRESGVLLRDQRSRNGVFVRDLRIHEAWIKPNMLFRVGHTTLELVAAEPNVVELSPRPQLGELHGQSEVMRELFARIERIAARGERLSILIHGETGTGKELVARALHDHSPRAHKPFVAINCATLTPSLAAMTLFGHDRGAFTDAHQARSGCFEQADGGTLFLDEIAELPLEIQSAFLRVLQERKVCRTGEFKERPVDVRILCASHKDLHQLVGQRQFREDLYHRLVDYTLEIPPLRERGNDLLYLADLFIRQHAERGAAATRLSAEARDLLRSHAWPGNVRELASVIRTACVIAEGDEIKRRDLSIARTIPQARSSLAEDLLHLPYKQALAQFRRIYWERLEQIHAGVLSKIARSAQISVEGARQALIKLHLRAA